jgi:hypothetical protein
VKKILWSVATVILLLNTWAVPVKQNADGGSPPLCPTQKSGCKPLVELT